MTSEKELFDSATTSAIDLARKEERAKIIDSLSVLENIADLYRHLVLDTPEDQKIHNDITATADRALTAVRVSLDTV